MNIPSSFADFFLQSRTKQLEANQIQVGQAYFNALLKKAIFIDLARISIRDNINEVKKVLIHHLEKMVNCQVREEEISYVVGGIFIANDQKNMKSIEQWILETLAFEYESSFQLYQNSRNIEYSTFQYTSQQIESFQNTPNENIIKIPSPSHQQHQYQHNQQHEENKNLNNLLANLDISQIPKLQPTSYQGSNFQNIENYINTIQVYRSEINLLAQQMKLPSPIYQRSKFDNRYYVNVYINICNWYTNMNNYQYIGYGNSINYKQGCQLAAKQLFNNVCRNLPQIINDFIRIKKDRGWFE